MEHGDTQSKQLLLDEVSKYEIPLLKAPSTVLDIGANVGAFSVIASKKWPDAKITAYEPVQENQEVFRRNCPNPNIVLNPSAVRSFSGIDNILLGDCCVTHAFKNIGRQTEKTLTVDCTNAATIPSCEFVKIDTEGCELEIVQLLDFSNTKAAAIEYHSSQDRQDIVALMIGKGFEVFRPYNCGVKTGVIRFVRKGVELDIPKQKLFIGIPVYGSVEINFWKCTMHLMASFPVNCVVFPVCGDSLIPRARNYITRKFLESDCSHLLMIDSDLIFSTDHITRILSHDEDVIGGFYPKKKEGAPEMVCNIKEVQPPMDNRRLLDLKYIGTGFICVKRNVFEKMIEQYSDSIAYTCDHDRMTIEHDLWPVGVYKYSNGELSRYLSEDWYFCQRAIDCGFKVYGDMGILLKHTGSATYPLSYQEEKIFTKTMSTSSSDSAATELESPPERERHALLTV